MAKKLWIGSKNVRFVTMLSSIIGLACALLPGTSAAFSKSSLSGGYGCVGQVRPFVSGNTSDSGISEIMRLGFDGAGQVRGTILFNEGGEVCNIAASGKYSVKSSGLGSIDLDWNSATGDADGDTDCAKAIDGAGFAQHMGFVIEGNGATLDFQASDDFLTKPGSDDQGDEAAIFTGSCKTQS